MVCHGFEDHGDRPWFLFMVFERQQAFVSPVLSDDILNWLAVFGKQYVVHLDQGLPWLYLEIASIPLVGIDYFKHTLRCVGNQRIFSSKNIVGRLFHLDILADIRKMVQRYI